MSEEKNKKQREAPPPPPTPPPSRMIPNTVRNGGENKGNGDKK